REQVKSLGALTWPQDIASLLPKRRADAHKGDFGKLLLLCGSVGLTGAAAMAAKAALRAGAGLISLGVPQSIYPILAAKLDAVMVFPLPEEDGCLGAAAIPEILRRLGDMDACLLGPGLGRGASLLRIVRAVLSGAGQCPVVLDADGINALENHIDVLRGAACPVVLTPHDGEFRRLGGDLLRQDRFQAAKKLAKDVGAVVLLKGHRTIVTDGAQLCVNMTGNPGMATGGSGDVLAGMLTAFLGQGLGCFEAARAAACLHGAAGDLCAEEIGQYGMTPGDIIAAIPRLLP
ncbi:MAG: NAD(P)H-hydrate dehydratase, partial [Oscillospiraceae bacterium]|nr:NAD(P)H-hydrate dehydratase [Oscillospiraceae bacterium]